MHGSTIIKAYDDFHWVYKHQNGHYSGAGVLVSSSSDIDTQSYGVGGSLEGKIFGRKRQGGKKKILKKGGGGGVGYDLLIDSAA